MFKPSTWTRKLLTALCALGVSLGGLSALATELPPGVLHYLRQKDPNVKVRFDGVVLFSSGEVYVPIIPQDSALQSDPQQVILTVPEQAAFPDLIEFDNHFFLLRLIQTASGRLTFPKMSEYPIQLKEGLLPQDLVMPNNLFIPVELKVILGALPYNPDYVPPPIPDLTPAAEKLKNVGSASQASHRPARQHLTYVFDLDEQKLLTIDPVSGFKQADVGLGCVPSSLRLSPDGKLLFAPCLSTNELAVIDTGSNLVKTRIPVGQRPDAVIYFDNRQEVVVSNRYSSFLSVIDAGELLPGEKIALPGNGGAMGRLSPDEKENRIAVADAFKPQVYLVDTAARSTLKTLSALPDVSALKVIGDELWMASRSRNQVQVINMNSGQLLNTFSVGSKPVDMAVSGSRLFVLSAGQNQLDVFNWTNRTQLEPIPLADGSFPSAIFAVPGEQRAYITTANANHLIVVNLAEARVESTLTVDFRGSLITMTPDAASEAEQLQQALNNRPQGPAVVETPTRPAAATDNPGNKLRKKARKPARKAQPESAAEESSPPAETPKARQPDPPPQPAPVIPAMSRPGFNPALNPEAIPTQGGGGRVTFKLGQEKKPAKSPEGEGARPGTSQKAPARPLDVPDTPPEDGLPMLEDAH